MLINEAFESRPRLAAEKKPDYTICFKSIRASSNILLGMERQYCSLTPNTLRTFAPWVSGSCIFCQTQHGLLKKIQEPLALDRVVYSLLVLIRTSYGHRPTRLVDSWLGYKSCSKSSGVKWHLNVSDLIEYFPRRGCYSSRQCNNLLAGADLGRKCGVIDLQTFFTEQLKDRRTYVHLIKLSSKWLTSGH